MVSEFDVFCEDVETNDTKNERYLNGAWILFLKLAQSRMMGQNYCRSQGRFC
jgi:hypothetical protein